MSIEELEKLRIKSLIKTIIVEVIAGGFLTWYLIYLLKPFFASSFTMPGSGIFLKAFIIFVVLLVTIFLVLRFNHEYKNAVRKSLLKGILDELLDNAVYFANDGIRGEVIRDTNSILSHKYHYNGSNLVEGKYKNIDVRMSDVYIYEITTDSDGRSSNTTIFSGQWMIFSFNKTFKSNVQVWEKNLTKYRENIDNFVNVDLEDIEFNNKFQVYSNNEVEAFYILTPNMIGKIKEIERELKGGLLLVFNNNQLHIGIKNNKQTFTPSLFINVHKFVDSCYRDIKTVMKLVDLLELDNDLFKVDTTISSN